jgi:UDP-glucuronate decarboxylase
MHRILREDFERILPYVPDKEALKGSRWLITGATGIVLSYLTAFLSWMNETQLDESLTVTALQRRPLDSSDPNLGFLLGRKGLTFRTMDLSKEFSLGAGEDFDYVVHGASHGAPRDYLADPLATMNSNVRGTQIILDHLRMNGRIKAYLQMSSVEIYGEVEAKDVPTPEEYQGRTNHLSSRSCNVESKRFSETLCLQYCRQYGIPVKILRLAQVYGPGFKEHDSRVWVDFLVRASRGKNIEILSDGTARRGFCYVADALTQMLTVARRGEIGGVYNIGNDEHVSIRELADLVSNLSGRPIEVVVKNELPDYLKGSPRISCPSIEKVRALHPLLKTPLRQGLKNSYDWFNDRI